MRRPLLVPRSTPSMRLETRRRGGRGRRSRPGRLGTARSPTPCARRCCAGSRQEATLAAESTSGRRGARRRLRDQAVPAPSSRRCRESTSASTVETRGRPRRSPSRSSPSETAPSTSSPATQVLEPILDPAKAVELRRVVAPGGRVLALDARRPGLPPRPASTSGAGRTQGLEQLFRSRRRVWTSVTVHAGVGHGILHRDADGDLPGPRCPAAARPLPRPGRSSRSLNWTGKLPTVTSSYELRPGQIYANFHVVAEAKPLAATRYVKR